DSVDGNTPDYIFNSYIGASVKPVPDLTGEYFTGLAIGTYTVTATSKATGCVSAPASADVLEQLEYPDFDFGMQPSSCDESNGFLTVILTTNVPVATIECSYDGTTTLGPNLSVVPAGFYTVTVT